MSPLRASLSVFLLVQGLAFGCATTSTTNGGASTESDPVIKASDVALDVVRRSIVQRVVREAPAVTRGGVARLVTMVPLDDGRMHKMATSVSRVLSTERMENDVATRIDRALGDDAPAVADALKRADVAAVVNAALTDPQPGELESFMAEPKRLPEERRARVQALVDVTWSPGTVDALTRAPVAAAGRIVASALKSGDDDKRSELMKIAETERPSDARALIIAFAFLWRDLDDATLDSARAWFASDLGMKSTRALVAASIGAVDDLAAAVAADVAR